MGLKFIEKGDKVIAKKDYDKLMAELEAMSVVINGAAGTIDHINESGEKNPFRDALFLVAGEQMIDAKKRSENVKKLLKGL